MTHTEKTQQQTLDDNRLVVRMIDDFKTSSFNLGERTFEKDKVYQVDRPQFEELIESGCASEITERKPLHYQCAAPLRPLVAVRSTVTRSISANGLDTHYLVDGEVSRVPSNLAQYLIDAGRAVAI